MATFTSSTTLLFTFLLLQGHHVPFAAADCSNHTCGEGGPTIRLPFYISDNPDNRITNVTDHRLFGLTCKNYTGQTMFKFPNSGEFVVDTIDYVYRQVQFRDPDGCLARRLREPFDLSGTYLSHGNYAELEFVNCSIDVGWMSYKKVGCLSGEGYSVYMGHVDPLEYIQYGCVESWTVTVPVPWEGWTIGGFPETFWFTWSQEFDCQIPPDQIQTHGRRGISGFFLHTKLGIIFITIICVCICCALCRKAIVSLDPGHPTSAPPPDQQPHLTTHTVMGMDMSVIELAFPKTRVGDTLQLPRVEDNTCSICLSEYQAEDTLRTITECNHYFHADCVDEWLKKNATCPLCRNYQAVYILDFFNLNNNVGQNDITWNNTNYNVHARPNTTINTM